MKLWFEVTSLELGLHDCFDQNVVRSAIDKGKKFDKSVKSSVNDIKMI